MSVSTLYAPVGEDLKRVSEGLNGLARVDSTELSAMIRHLTGSEGKQIRPALTLLAGKFYYYDLSLLLPMAMGIELLHIASLVHDDALDKASLRRNRSTINALWGGNAAVLLGDYLFSNASNLTASTGSVRAVKLFSQALMNMIAGELSQTFSSFNVDQTRSQYYQRIGGKTASLFSTATESGAVLSNSPEEAINALRDYGYNLGIAFQIVDDILDFVGKEEEMGKPVGSDLAQGTLTLPGFILLERYPENNPIRRLFKHQQPDDLELALEMVRSNPSIIEECYEVASDFCSQSCTALDALPLNAARDSLVEIAKRAVRRIS